MQRQLQRRHSGAMAQPVLGLGLSRAAIVDHHVDDQLKAGQTTTADKPGTAQLTRPWQVAQTINPLISLTKTLQRPGHITGGDRSPAPCVMTPAGGGRKEGTAQESPYPPDLLGGADMVLAQAAGGKQVLHHIAAPPTAARLTPTWRRWLRLRYRRHRPRILSDASRGGGLSLLGFSFARLGNSWRKVSTTHRHQPSGL